MCGRARCTLRADDIPRACNLNGRPVRVVDADRYRPAYNVSPGFNLPVVRRDRGSDGQGVVLQVMKWGLIPSFTKKTDKPDHYRMFNARSESICEKASFRRLVPSSRCLVAVEGFYEWKKDGPKNQPYYVHFKDDRPLIFAALYDSWKNSEGEILYTFTILTTSSSSALEWLHDRMPVILGNKELTDAWLYGSPSSKFDTMLKPYEEPDLAWYPVTPAMGKPSFDGPDCIKEIQLKAGETKPISSFFKKGITREQGSAPVVKSEGKDPIATCQGKSKEEETEIQETIHYHFPERICEGSKPDVPKLDEESKPDVSVACEGERHFQVKREFEELSADAIAPNCQTDIPSKSPKKKRNARDAGDKQQLTLFSYFGKG